MSLSLIVASQRLGKPVPVGTNTHATIGERIDASFYMWLMSYQKKAGI
jgi:hypothetical protein